VIPPSDSALGEGCRQWRAAGDPGQKGRARGSRPLHARFAGESATYRDADGVSRVRLTYRGKRRTTARIAS